MERVIDVAQYIFDEYRRQSGEIIDEMKLHKLLYFAQRESLAITGNALFNEQFEGWKFGPVCREIRNVYTNTGMYCNDIKEISNESAYVVKNVILEYGALASWKLSDLSHKEISWNNTRIGLKDGENGNKLLKLEDIKKDAEKVRPYDHIWDMYYDEFDDAEDYEA